MKNTCPYLAYCLISAFVCLQAAEVEEVEKKEVDLLNVAKDPFVKAKIELFSAVKADKVNEVKTILAAYPKLVNELDDYGKWTLLHWAAMDNSTEIAELLLAKGANKEAQDDCGWTPLHWAARYNKKEVAELLLTNGANKDPRNKEGKTPLDLAWEGNSADVAELLKKPFNNANKQRNHKRAILWMAGLSIVGVMGWLALPTKKGVRRRTLRTKRGTNKQRKLT